jgi:FixJ family two-component response regulator
MLSEVQLAARKAHAESSSEYRAVLAKAHDLRHVRDQLKLTDAQMLVLLLFHAEHSNKGAARVLGLSSRTVEIHRHAIKERMGCRTLVGMVLRLERAMAGISEPCPN